MKNVTKSASGGVSGASLFRERPNELPLMFFFVLLAPLGRILVPFGRPLDFEKGVPKSTFFKKH